MPKTQKAELLTRDDAQELIQEHFRNYLKVLKGFVWGLGLFFVIVISSGLISKRNLLALMHDSIFGNEPILMSRIGESISSQVAISYHRSFILRTPDQPNEKMLFYAKPNQVVKVYIEVSHYGPSQEFRRLMVWLDGNVLWDKIEDLKGGFKDISSRVYPKNGSPSVREESVHALEFNLDDTQIKDLKDDVFVDCVIIVFGNSANVKTTNK